MLLTPTITVTQGATLQQKRSTVVATLSNSDTTELHQNKQLTTMVAI